MEYKNNKIDITLDNALTGIALDNDTTSSWENPKTSSSWTVERFYIDKEKSRGVVFTSKDKDKTKQIQSTYGKYFYTTFPGNIRSTNRITGVTPGTENTGILTFASSTAGSISGLTKNDLKPNGGDNVFSYDTELASGDRKVKFLGVEGELKCTNGTCKVYENDQGFLVFEGQSNTTITFDPEETGDKLKKSEITHNMIIIDKDYANFGYWLTSNNKKHMIDTFAEFINGPSSVLDNESHNVQLIPLRESLGNWVFTAARESD